MDKGKRILWLDNLKLFLMIFVIFGHVKNLCNVDVIGMKWASEFWVAWDMPAFVFLSGYMSFNSLSKIKTKESLFTYLKKISKRMLLPLIVAVAVLRAISLGSIGNFSSMWFVDYILYSVVIFSIFLLVSKQNLWISSILYFALSCIINRWYMSDMMWYFVMGLFFKKYNILDKYVLSEKFKVTCLIIIVFVVSFLLFYFYTHSYKFYFNTYSDLYSIGLGYIYVLRIIVAIGFTLFLVYMFKTIGGADLEN